MSEEQLERVFDPFEQTESRPTERTRRRAISQKFVELLGGSVNVTSELGRGSRFVVEIPSLGDPVPAGAEEAGSIEPASLAEKHDGEPARRDLLGLHVLVAEDGPDNQRLVRFLLERAGARVRVVENGQLALDAIEVAASANQPFDLVVLDMQMPVLDGYQTARRLRERGSRVPIVALTAHAMSSDRERCLEAGCDAYETKPIDAPRLIQVLAGLANGDVRDAEKAD